MRVSIKTLSLATAALIVASPVAFAQNRDGGPADAGMSKPSTGMTTKGTSTDSGRSSSTTTTGSSKMTNPGLGNSAETTTKGTATGGAAGTPAAK